MKSSTGIVPISMILAMGLLLGACQPAGDGPQAQQPATRLAVPTSASVQTAPLLPPSKTPLPSDTQAPTEHMSPPTSVPFNASGLPSEEWVQLSNMPTSRSEMPAAVLNGRIYVPGGFGNGLDEGSALALEVYEPASDSWQSLRGMPAGRHHLMSAALEGVLYVFGGACIPGCSGGSNTAWAYNPEGDVWRELAPMPERRTAGAAVALEGFLYVVGGDGDTGDLLRYDPSTDAWTRLAPLLESREHTAAVAVNGEIYALGGRWRAELSSVEVYNPAADEWRPAQPMHTARAGHGAAVLEEEIYVLGGEVILSEAATDLLESVEVFDPASGRWRSGPTLPTGLHGFPAAVYQGVLYALGGSGQAGAVSNQGQVYAWRP